MTGPAYCTRIAPVRVLDKLLVTTTAAKVELGFVPLESLGADSSRGRMGLVVYSDYTDRETLLRNVDPDDLTSGRGFTIGKSFPGFLPVGNLFVIPRDVRRFSASVELRLYVNGELRQRDVMGHAVWDIDEILRRMWRCRDMTWEFRGQQVPLLGLSDLLAAPGYGGHSCRPTRCDREPDREVS